MISKYYIMNIHQKKPLKNFFTKKNKINEEAFFCSSRKTLP